MQKEMTATTDDREEHQSNEELTDVLIAISVIAKRLAKKISEEKSKGEDKECTNIMD